MFDPACNSRCVRSSLKFLVLPGSTWRTIFELAWWVCVAKSSILSGNSPVSPDWRASKDRHSARVQGNSPTGLDYGERQHQKADDCTQRLSGRVAALKVVGLVQVARSATWNVDSRVFNFSLGSNTAASVATGEAPFISVCLYVGLVCLAVCLSCLSGCLVFVSICLVCLSVCLSVLSCLSVCLSARLVLSVCLSVGFVLSICLSCLSVCLSISICRILSVSLPLSLSQSHTHSLSPPILFYFGGRRHCSTRSPIHRW